MKEKNNLILLYFYYYYLYQQRFNTLLLLFKHIGMVTIIIQHREQYTLSGTVNFELKIFN